MALFSDLSAESADFDASRALRVPLGAASPLWFAFASVASAGVAYWWMTRWTQPANLEAFSKWLPEAKTEVEAEVKAQPFAVLPAVAAEPTIETAVAAALEPITAAADVMVETVTEVAEPTVVAVEEVAEETVEVTAAVVDDLTRIVGIGPRLAERLSDLGVKSFKELAAWKDEDLARFDKELDLKGRAVRDAWIAQARRFAEA